MCEADDEEDFLFELKRGHKKKWTAPMAEFPIYAPMYQTVSRRSMGMTWEQWLRSHGWESRHASEAR
jgi:hypothetical protein